MDARHYHPKSLAQLRTDALTRGAYPNVQLVLAAVLQHPVGGGVGSGPQLDHPVGGGIGSGAESDHPMGGGIGSDTADEHPMGGGVGSGPED
jgi:hypothetical protein